MTRSGGNAAVKDTDSSSIGWLGLLGRGIIALTLLLSCGQAIERAVNLATPRSANAEQSLGFGTVAMAGGGVGWLTISWMIPGGGGAKAGLRTGDSVRFEQFLGSRIAWQPGERVRIEVARGGKHFRVTAIVHAAMIPPPSMVPESFQIAAVIGVAQTIVANALCLFLLIRGWRNRSAVLLAVILLTGFGLGVPTSILPNGLASALLLGAIFMSALIAWAWPVFCLQVSGGASSARMERLVHAAAAAMYVLFLYVQTASGLPVSLPGAGPAALGIIAIVNQGFGYAILASNYRRHDAATRNRVKIIVLAFICLLLSVLLNAGASLMPTAPLELSRLTQFLWVATVGTILVFIGLVLLTYAVLRQRLFDLGFAMNRTLVYGAVSFILLAGFGLAEWSVEHLIPTQWHEGGPFFSAGIALALFLSFHRLRDWVESHIERLFFHKWHRNEAELRRFVASAGHFRQAPILCREFAAEVERFAHGAGAALYLREENGDYSRQAGDLPGAPQACIDDDRLLALMRAERTAVDMSHTPSAFPGALALPMLDQLGLAGFMLLGASPNGAQYRPDEVENLAWAVQQVGLALQALDARELRAEIISLRAQLARREERKRRPTTPRLATVARGAKA